MPGMDSEDLRMSGWLAWAAAWMAGLSALVGLRVWRGPTTADRVVGLDAINTMVVASMIALAAAGGGAMWLDVAAVYAALSFVGTLYIARTLGGKGGK